MISAFVIDEDTPSTPSSAAYASSWSLVIEDRLGAAGSPPLLPSPSIPPMAMPQQG